MNLPFLDRLPPPTEWPTWLETELVGLNLGDLVIELTALGEATGRREISTTSPELDDVLGAQLPEVLDQGLSGVELERLEELLRHPALLLELQERVLVEGGDYWQRVPVTRTQRDRIEQQWSHLERLLSLAGSAKLDGNTEIGCGTGTVELPWDTKPNWDAAVDEPASIPAQPARIEPAAERQQPLPTSVPQATRPTAWKTWLGFAVTVTACVTLMVWQPWTPPPAPWGFNNPAALAQTGTPQEYWSQLASAGQQWFKKRPDSPEALRTRLESYRKGCDTLLSAPHTPLSSTEREVLVAACRTCRAEIEGHLQSLAQQTPVPVVLEAADASINKLLAVLNEHAAT